MLNKVHLIHTQAQNTFSLIGLILHIFKNRYTERLCTSIVGRNPNYTIQLVTLDKMKKYIKSQIYGHLEHFLIAHAAFLDSGSFCKTKNSKEVIFFLLKG